MQQDYSVVHGFSRAPLTRRAPPLKWDLVIEKAANDWTRVLNQTCSLYHPSTVQDRNLYLNFDGHFKGYQPFGQNLYLFMSSTLTAATATDVQIASYYKKAVKSWFSECFNYPTNNGTMGHYTQLVWRTTSRLGCSHTFCRRAGMGAIIVACNYEPGGNVVGQTSQNVIKNCV